MCIDCWNEAGKPTEVSDTEALAELLVLIRVLYEDHGAGGPLHTVLDDWNLDGEISPYWMHDEPAVLEYHCLRIAALLNAMPLDERIAAMAYADGFIAPPPPPPEWMRGKGYSSTWTGEPLPGVAAGPPKELTP